MTLTKNYPNRLWVLVVLARLVLDGMAGLQFLLKGKPMHTLAIVKAHIAYYIKIPRVLGNRKNMRKRKNYTNGFTQVYRGSVVYAYYVKKIKSFSSLDKNRFS